MKKTIALLLALVLLAGICTVASAEEWKFERGITIVCPWGLGGGADGTIRPMATLLQEKLGVPVDVRNEAGGGGVTGATFAYKEPADGYTFLLATQSLYIQDMMDNMDFDFKNEFECVDILVHSINMLAGSRVQMEKYGIKNFSDLKAYAAEHPYEVSVAMLTSTGVDGMCFEIATEGLALNPVPKYGRGLELLRLLHAAGMEGPFFGDAYFLREIGKLPEYRNWLKDDPKQLQPLVKPYSGTEKRGILFLSDPQLRTDASRAAVRLALAAGGKAIMTGTAERGSYSAQLLGTGQMELLRYPVHLNKEQMAALANENSFSRVIAYHSPEIPSEEVYRV